MIIFYDVLSHSFYTKSKGREQNWRKIQIINNLVNAIFFTKKINVLRLLNEAEFGLKYLSMVYVHKVQISYANSFVQDNHNIRKPEYILIFIWLYNHFLFLHLVYEVALAGGEARNWSYVNIYFGCRVSVLGVRKPCLGFCKFYFRFLNGLLNCFQSQSFLGYT